MFKKIILFIFGKYGRGAILILFFIYVIAHDYIILKITDINYVECKVVKIFSEGQVRFEYEVDNESYVVSVLINSQDYPAIELGERGKWIFYSKRWPGIARFDNLLLKNPERSEEIIKIRLEERDFENTEQCNSSNFYP